MVETIRRFVEREVMPVASELEHRNEYPHAARRAHEGARPLRRHDPGRVRRPRPRLHHLRHDHRGALRRLDEPERHPQHASAARLHDPHARHRGRRSSATCRRWRRGEHRGALCLTEPHAGSDVQRIRTTAMRARRRLRRQRQQDVRHQRAPAATSTPWSCKTDPRGGSAAQGHEPVRRREGTRHHRQPRHRQARLQGRRHLRGAVRGLPRAGRQPARRQRRATACSRC